MTQLTIAEIRERKAELERQIAAMLSELENQSGLTITKIEYFQEGVFAPGEGGFVEVMPLEGKAIIRMEVKL